MYKVPKDYFFRLHHVRPRFKSDVENVLIFLAEELKNIARLPNEEFALKFNQAIYRYPGNEHRKLKTINNWRTEISALFGFIEHFGDETAPGLRAIELAEKKDLIEFFKTFLFNFQYPGAHIKAHEIKEQIDAGVHFKPAQYILRLLRYASQTEKRSIGITKFEICHCIFNDLRCIRDNDPVSETWKRIENNRRNNVEYDQTGDVIRYAGDIVDYMEIANLLKSYDGRTYYLNNLDEEAIIKFIESSEWFSGYDGLYQKNSIKLSDINMYYDDWFSYVNRPMGKTDFSTDILALIADDEADLARLKKAATKESEAEKLEEEKTQVELEVSSRIEAGTEDLHTKDIGDIGELLVHSHECMRIKLGGHEELIHLVKRIPTSLALGYDISSVELNAKKRYIEVKTTISAKPLHFNRIHLTANEWNTADSLRDRYFVYRLMVSRDERKLFLLQNPVGLYKQDKIDMVINDGADITFNPKHVGQFEELLTWKRED